LFAAVRWATGIGRGHRFGIERMDVAVVADHHPQPLGGKAMAVDDDPAGGGDIDVGGAELMGCGHLAHRKCRRHRILVAFHATNACRFTFRVSVIVAG
jgi:hypothetical protein